MLIKHTSHYANISKLKEPKNSTPYANISIDKFGKMKT